MFKGTQIFNTQTPPPYKESFFFSVQEEREKEMNGQRNA